MKDCNACEGSGKTEDQECRGCSGDRETGGCICEPLSAWCPECDGSGYELASEAACELIAEWHAEEHPADWNDVAMLAEMRSVGYVDRHLWESMARARGAHAESDATDALSDGRIGEHAYSVLMSDIATATGRALSIDPRCPPRATRPAQVEAHKEVA